MSGYLGSVCQEGEGRLLEGLTMFYDIIYIGMVITWEFHFSVCYILQ